MERLEPPFRFDSLADVPAVFVVHVRDGQPYLGRTTKLRRRLQRLLGESARTLRLLNLREIATSVEIHFTASRLDASLLYYELARLHFPESYGKLVKLRLPPFVKVILSNHFPRTQVTTKLSAAPSLYFGPFRTRAQAERFEGEALNLFQVRRCQEDLVVSPDHPGCIYGEMSRCMRPCQAAVSQDEYASEVQRLTQFFATSGQSLLSSARAARDRSSDEMDFEEAQRQHQRIRRIEQVMKLADDLVAPLSHLNGVTVTPSVDPGCVEIRVVLEGQWTAPVRFQTAPDATGEMVPLDRRLRDALSGVSPSKIGMSGRAEHIALLARWYYSSWRDGEWIPFESQSELPYRKLVRAISRVASGAHAPRVQ